MEPLGIEEIKQYIAHRYPFLLIDRVTACEAGKRIVALKNVSANEPFFAGHFPNQAVMPGVLIIEAMAQASAVLAALTLGKKDDGSSLFYFVGIDNARFKRVVRPGDQLTIEVSVVRIARGIGKFTATAKVGEQLAAEADLLSAMRSATSPEAGA